MCAFASLGNQWCYLPSFFYQFVRRYISIFKYLIVAWLLTLGDIILRCYGHQSTCRFQRLLQGVLPLQGSHGQRNQRSTRDCFSPSTSSIPIGYWELKNNNRRNHIALENPCHQKKNDPLQPFVATWPLQPWQRKYMNKSFWLSTGGFWL
jgi:hypothetical protein